MRAACPSHAHCPGMSAGVARGLRRSAGAPPAPALRPPPARPGAGGEGAPHEAGAGRGRNAPPRSTGLLLQSAFESPPWAVRPHAGRTCRNRRPDRPRRAPKDAAPGGDARVRVPMRSQKTAFSRTHLTCIKSVMPASPHRHAASGRGGISVRHTYFCVGFGGGCCGQKKPAVRRHRGLEQHSGAACLH